MSLVIDNRCVYEDCIFENPLWEEILDVLENNGFVVDEEIDKIYIRKLENERHLDTTSMCGTCARHSHARIFFKHSRVE